MPKPQSELPENQVTPNPGLEKCTRRAFSCGSRRERGLGAGIDPRPVD